MLLRLILFFIVLSVVYITLRGYAIIKRKKDRSKTDLQLLKPRKTGILKEFDISGKGEDVMQAIINSLEEKNPKMIRSSNDEALIYFDTGESKAKGMLVTPDENMPVRLILKKKHKKLFVQIDEDYRQPMLVKTGKKILNEKYKNTFNYYLDIIESKIKDY